MAREAIAKRWGGNGGRAKKGRGEEEDDKGTYFTFF
jgi:hypothetical protein